MQIFSLQDLKVLGKKTKDAMLVGFHIKRTTSIWKKQSKQNDEALAIGIFVAGIPSINFLSDIISLSFKNLAE